MEATEDTGFQAETLRGDVRDKFMDEVVRRMPGWTQMREHEQKAIISTVNSIACQVIREVAQAVTHRGFIHMQINTGEWKVKDGIKLATTAAGSVENITKLAEHGSGEAILIFAEAGTFFGQRADAAFDKDEPELPMDGQPAHDPETGEVLDQGDAGDGNPLPESQPLPEMSNDDIDTAADGDSEGDDEGEADEQPDEQPEEEPAPPPRGSRSRRRALADADA